jgi:hypothetical protein
MVVSALRYFNLPLQDIERLTLREYDLYMEVYQLKQIDHQEDLAMQAWLNQASKATKKGGKSQYKNFKDFFDAEKMEKKVLRAYEGEEHKELDDEQTKRQMLAKFMKERSN